MAKIFDNLIAGTWPAGADTTENRNPSELGDVIGLYAQSNSNQLEEAVSAARKALPAWVFTKSIARATHFRRNVDTGCVMINLPTAGTDYHVPFGGRKNSSSAPREQGRGAAEFYTQIKTAYIHAGDPE